MSKYLDSNGLLYFWQKIKELAGGKVDKENGKRLMTDAEGTKLAAFGEASIYALKSDVASMYKYKGSKATVSDLPSSGNAVGDVWDVQASGMNYAWNGSAWDALGGVLTVESITNADIDTVVNG